MRKIATAAFFILLAPTLAFGSDMTAVGLASIVLEVAILVVISLGIAVVCRSRGAFHWLVALNLIALGQLLFVLPRKWELPDERFMLKALLGEIVLLLVVTAIYFARNVRDRRTRPETRS